MTRQIIVFTFLFVYIIHTVYAYPECLDEHINQGVIIDIGGTLASKCTSTCYLHDIYLGRMKAGQDVEYYKYRYCLKFDNTGVMCTGGDCEDVGSGGGSGGSVGKEELL